MRQETFSRWVREIKDANPGITWQEAIALACEDLKEGE